MSCGKCGNGNWLCPVSLGLALGLTSALGVFLWTLVSLFQGVDEIAWGAAAIYILVMFVKSFVFGFVLALVYDLVVTRCKGWCCRKSKDGVSDCKSK